MLILRVIYVEETKIQEAMENLSLAPFGVQEKRKVNNDLSLSKKSRLDKNILQPERMSVVFNSSNVSVFNEVDELATTGAFSQERGTSQELAATYQLTGKRVGVLVAGNAGCPGGAIGKMDGSGLRDSWDHIKRTHYRTQEESIIRDWLAGAEVKGKTPEIYFRTQLGDLHPGGRPWGMLNPSMKNKKTIQGFDYTQPLFNSKRDRSFYYNFAFPRQGDLFVNGRLVPVTVVFVFGPNVASAGSPYGSTARTKVASYTDAQYEHFREAVKVALAAGMKAMQKAGVEVGILARVSGGIYSGRGSDTNKLINLDYEHIVNEIIATNPLLAHMEFIMPA